MISKSKKGFTLIELLIVIAIIGLLATLSIVSLNSARMKSRDARRVSDVRQIRMALEMYYQNATPNGYPSGSLSTTTSYCISATNGVAATCSGDIYMSATPLAPTPYDNKTGSACTASNNGYTYTQDSSGASYHITYCLGDVTGGIPAGANTATPAGLK